MKYLLPLFLLSLILMVGPANLVRAESPAPLVTEFSVPASPFQVTIESAGRIWFTQPSQNSVARLVVNSATDYEITTYPISTPNAEPYDIKYAGGMIWFTERLGNKIGRLNPTTGAIDECTVPTAGSQPTGIDALPGTPTQVWFTERTGNKLGKLVEDSPFTCIFTEYAVPTAGAQPEGIIIESGDRVWFTAPAVARIGRLTPSSATFALVPTGSGSQPWSIQVDASGYPWFTDRALGRIGKFYPSTLSDIRWYVLSSASSAPFDISLALGQIWFTEQSANRAGQIDPSNNMIRELGLAGNSTPAGLAVDSNGVVWIAASGRNALEGWSSPYFRLFYLPLVRR